MAYDTPDGILHWNGVRPVNEGVLYVLSPGEVPAPVLLVVMTVDAQDSPDLLVQCLCLAVRLLVVS